MLPKYCLALRKLKMGSEVASLSLHRITGHVFNEIAYRGVLYKQEVTCNYGRAKKDNHVISHLCFPMMWFLTPRSGERPDDFTSVPGQCGPNPGMGSLLLGLEVEITMEMLLCSLGIRNPLWFHAAWRVCATSNFCSSTSASCSAATKIKLQILPPAVCLSSWLQNPLKEVLVCKGK